MKLLSKFTICLFLAAALGACVSQNKDEEPYNRTGSKQEVENIFRNKVMAPYSGDGRFFATYYLAKLKKDINDKGYYTVEYLNGPGKGETQEVKNIVLKTEPVDVNELKKGDVVIYDLNNTKDLTKSSVDRWAQGVVHDVSQISKGVVVLEIPRDRNDFIPGKETINVESMRLITKPAVKDPRIFIR
ncbi:hypothetical protein AAIR98_000639 [Elusimicrobium simillimum]|uniref:hypothetical protein n=1 Tax=Elusimicrobium simillimum TaxID=3143438 RepID=UPI003C6F7DBD